MTTIQTAAQQALEALYEETAWFGPTPKGAAAIAALRAALAENERDWSMLEAAQEALREHMAEIHRLRAALAQQDEPQTLNDAMQQPRAMAQAYENGYKAGVAAEREACAKLCEARFMGDMTREDMEARRCAAAIRARGNT